MATVRIFDVICEEFKVPHKNNINKSGVLNIVHVVSKGCHLDVVGEPSSPHDPESDADGSLSSWQGHPSR
jgi:hypothetical protein